MTTMAEGLHHSIARASDGAVYAWGWNAADQLGDNSTTNRSTPVQVGWVSGASSVVAGSQHSAALKADGTMQGWGSNTFGQMRDGTRDGRTSPVSVLSLAGVNAGAAGQDHSLVAATVPLTPPSQPVSATYSYDGEGVRVGKVVNGTSTSYLQDVVGGLPRVLVETTGGQETLFVYGADLAFEVRPDGTHRYYHADALGSTRVVTDDAGAVVSAFSYDAYGLRFVLLK